MAVAPAPVRHHVHLVAACCWTSGSSPTVESSGDASPALPPVIEVSFVRSPPSTGIAYTWRSPGMHLGARDVERLPVGREADRVDLPLALGELSRRRARLPRHRPCTGASSRRARDRNQRRFWSGSQPNDGSFGPNPPTSRTHASSCSASSTRVVPDSGSTATSQRSLLSSARTCATAIAPSSDICGMPHRTSRARGFAWSAELDPRPTHLVPASGFAASVVVRL